MAKRGVKLAPEIETKVAATYVLTHSISATAKELGLSKSTVHGIVKNMEVRGDVVRPSAAAVMAEDGRPALETLDADGVRKTAYLNAGANVLAKKEVLRNIQAALAVRPNALIRRNGQVTEAEIAIADHEVVKGWVEIYQKLQIGYGIEIQNARLLNEQSTQIFESIQDLLTLPPGVSPEDVARIIKDSIHGRRILADVAEAEPQAQHKPKKPPKPILHVAPV